MISMSCPIHGGDNIGAINLYVQGDSYRGNWKCRTHNCEHIFKGSILGFIRGILSNQKYHWSKEGDDTCSFQEAVEFATKFLNKNLSDIKISQESKNKQQFANIINNIANKQTHLSTNTINIATRDTVRKSLIIPPKYFLDRGFSASILDKYDVGFCDKVGKEMYQRVVVPIYDNEYRYMIGCTGRSVFEKCPSCQVYHNPTSGCVTDSEKYLYSKWKHSLNFKSQNHLYNFWFAQKFIMDSGYAIIVESPGNVWRLEETDIHNSVAIFGSSLSDRQKMLLDGSGAMTLVILTDNDDAGKKAAEQIKQKCQNTYKIIIPQISKNDIADMNATEIKSEILPILESIK
jgi:DNA primase